jgi:hypothetical protein
MWILIIIGLAGAAAASIWLGFVPPPHAATLIHIRSGGLQVKRGRLQAHAREHVSEILQDAGVSRGFIAITSQNRVAFSRHIPSTVHQRLRNVLLNQWA